MTLVTKLLLFIFLFLSAPAQSYMVIPHKSVGAESVAKSAEWIVKARLEGEIQKGLSVFVVEEVIRGEGAVGDKINVRHPGLNFSKKRSYLLLLGKPNELGVRNIAGGFAGRYSISKNKEGKKVVHGLVPIPSAVAGGAQKGGEKVERSMSNEAGYEDFVEFLKNQ